jgi:hypothetical protein
MKIIPAYAPMLSARTAVGVKTASDFEREAECETCGFEGDMEFFEECSEVAAAECPNCQDRVECYIGPDAD